MIIKNYESYIKRIVNTLNQFKEFKFFIVGENDINCEVIRNFESNVLIRVLPCETIIFLLNNMAVECLEPLYKTITIKHSSFKTYNAIICIIFDTIKEYYENDVVLK